MNDAEFSKKRQFFKQFIRLYESFPCLWDLKSYEYHDRELRAKAYKVLVNKLQEIQPGADRMTVVRKINCLRSNLRKEKKKILEGLELGRVVKPRLWYHHHFDFLNGIGRKSEATHNEGVENIKIHNTSSQGQVKIENKTTELFEYVVDIKDEQNEEGPPQSLNTDRTEEHCQSAYEANQLNRSTDSVADSNFKLADSQRRPPPDRHDVFGNNVAMKLRHLSMTNDTQRIMAEKIINEALYMAEMGLLSIEHCNILK